MPAGFESGQHQERASEETGVVETEEALDEVPAGGIPEDVAEGPWLVGEVGPRPRQVVGRSEDIGGGAHRELGTIGTHRAVVRQEVVPVGLSQDAHRGLHPLAGAHHRQDPQPALATEFQRDETGLGVGDLEGIGDHREELPGLGTAAERAGEDRAALEALVAGGAFPRELLRLREGLLGVEHREGPLPRLAHHPGRFHEAEIGDVADDAAAIGVAINHLVLADDLRRFHPTR